MKVILYIQDRGILEKFARKLIFIVLLLSGLVASQHSYTQTTISECFNHNDIDADDDSLIEICDLESLNAIRYQLDGSGYRPNAAAAKITSGCAAGGCSGYELTRSLDFSDTASYSSTSNKVIWTTGEGWQPIGTRADAFGGLFEANGYTISNLYINRDVDNIGLFAKTASGSGINGLSLLNVNISGNFWVAAVAAVNEGTISNSRVVGGTLVGKGDHVGALAAANSGAMIDSFAELDVVGRDLVGGLVGSNEGETFVNNYASGKVEGRQAVGGLVGSNNGVIATSHALGDVKATANNVGGLVGVNNNSVLGSYAIGNVVGETGNIGGLVGANITGGYIINSYATGSVNGNADYVGGLVGINSDGQIRNSYAVGNVAATGDAVGGLAGGNDGGGRIRNSYATGNVKGIDKVGGLIGANAALIVHSYAVGTMSGDSDIGGLVGVNSSGDVGVIYSYWDISASLIARSDGGIPGVSEQLQAPIAAGSTATEIYYQWSNEDWDFGTAGQYPLLKYVRGDSDDSACASTLVLSNCGDLLTGQYTRLSGLILSGGLTLEPTFNPDVFDYNVMLNNRTTQLRLIPFLRNRDDHITITSDGNFKEIVATSGRPLSVPLKAAPAATLINIGRGYRINAIYGLDAVTIKLITPSDTHRVTEGESIILDASLSGNQDSGSLNYRWTQLYDKSLLSGVATDSAALEIAVPKDYVAGDVNESEVILQVEVSRGATRVRRQIALTIVKVNNDLGEMRLTAPTYSEATLKLSAPEVDDLVMYDADGGSDASKVLYQWQRKLADSTAWIDITAATARTYNILLHAGLTDFVHYRVRVIYTDGQGYRNDVASKAYTFIKDIDKDDDGLIDIDYLEDLDAVRYQLDGKGYSSGEGSVKLTGGCPLGECIGYELTRDLDFQSDASYRDAAQYKSLWTSGEGWQPIGVVPTAATNSCALPESRCFDGVFEGNGYKIFNLTINRPAADGVGLFGFASGSIIRNIGLVNVNIRGRDYSGALVGYHNEDNQSRNGEITNSYATGQVRGRDYVGGFIGLNNRDLIENSFMSGDVSGRAAVGGLIGRNHGGRINKAYSEGTVVGTTNNTGGLVGSNDRSAMNSRDGEIADSYAVSDVQGHINVGGLVGLNNVANRIIRCYAASGVVGLHGSSGGLVGTNHGTITNSYWDTQVSEITTGSDGEGRTTAQLKSPIAADAINPDIYIGWHSDVWDFGGRTHYPILRATGNALLLSTVRYGLKDLLLADKAIWSPPFKPSVQHYIGTVINDSDVIHLTPIALEAAARIDVYASGIMIAGRVVGNTTAHQITLSASSATRITIEVQGAATVQYTLDVSYQYRDIDTDDDGLIELNSFAALNAMRYQVDGSGYRASEGAAKVTTGCPIVGDSEVCSGYELTRNLDFNDAQKRGTMTNWQPIGSADNPFVGRFNGGGYTISNLIINRPTQNAVGLFGVVEGIIDNVGLVNADVVGGVSVGALAGLNRGMIRNSFTSGNVAGSNGSHALGGLVGYNESTATIINSYTSANLRTAVHSGGLVGVNAGHIAACYATGNVDASDYAGGFAGRNQGTISNSYASGNVTGRDYGGGFAAWNDSGTITNSYAVGTVRASLITGGFVALNVAEDGTLSTVSHSYWDRQTTVQSSSAGGVGFSTVTLKTFTTQSNNLISAYYLWDENIWQFNDGLYPLLKHIEGPDHIGNPACSDSPTLPSCGSVLSAQSLGLADLTVASPLGINFFPSFRSSALDYRTTVYSDTHSIQLTPTTYSTATVVINSDTGSGDFSRGNGTLSDPIPLSSSGETLLTIDVMSTGKRSLRYQIIVERSAYFSEAIDIDADDDGLIEISYLEDLNAVRYQLDGSGYKATEAGSKITKGCDENDTRLCIGYELVTDLDFNDSRSYRDATAHRIAWTTAAGWQPIGTDIQAFSGLFIGNGHTISNLIITRPDDDNIGLFGTIKGTDAKIEYLGLYNANIVGNRRVGSIAGFNEGGTIAHSYALLSSVEGRGMDAGGLVGSHNSGGNIINSYADVRVTGINTVGGLVGAVNNSNITHCYAIAKVSGDNDVGGLVGYTNGGNIIRSYWDTDSSEQPSSAGGAIGFTTTALQAATAPGNVSEPYHQWDDQVWHFGTDRHYPALLHENDSLFSNQRVGLSGLKVIPKGLAGLGEVLLTPAFSRDILDYRLKVYKNLQSIRLVTTAYHADAAIRISSNGGDGSYSKTIVSGNTSDDIPLRPSGKTLITIEVTVPGGHPLLYRIALSYYAASAIPDNIDNDSDGLIEIYFLEDLDAIRYQPDGSGYKASESAVTHSFGCPETGCIGYELVRDLDFNDAASYRQSEHRATWTTGSGWQPLGTAPLSASQNLRIGVILDECSSANAHCFSGVFKANGHNISNLKINRPTKDGVGLFGAISSTARIEQVGLLGVDVVGKSEVGSLIGHSEGTVINSYAKGKVEGKNVATGGLVGISKGTVIYSYADVQTIGGGHVGGLIGSMTGGKITINHAVGSVKGSSRVGGFIGTVSAADGMAENNYATGGVVGNFYIGSFVGQISEGIVRNNYAIGEVTGTRFVSGFAASVSMSDPDSHNYWDTQTSKIGTHGSDGVGGAKGFNTEALQSPTTPTATVYVNWDPAIWHFGTAKQYPRLKYVAGSDVANPICGTSSSATNLPECGTLLANQYIGLSDLRFNLTGVELSPEFDRTLFDYRLTVYADTEYIRAVASTYHPNAVLRILNDSGFSQLTASTATGFMIPLNSGDATVITIDVQAPGAEVVSYRIEIDRLHHLNGAENLDIDKDNDGLIDINTAGQLNAIRYQLDGSGYRESEDTTKITEGCPDGGCKGYELMQNIDLNGISFEGPIGTKDKPFEGIFNGNNKTIANLTINRPSTDYVALFGATGNMVRIRNIGLLNVDITGNDYVGSLVGLHRGLQIANSYAIGKVAGRKLYTGGLVGQTEGAAKTIINSHARVQVSGVTYVGGFIGRLASSSFIQNSYATGDVSGERFVGGFVGNRAQGKITDSYATGDVSGTSIFGSNVGGFIGLQSTSSGLLQRSYAIGNVSGDSSFVGGFVGGGDISNPSYNYWNSDIVSGRGSDNRYQGFSTKILQSAKGQRVSKQTAYYSWTTINWNFGSDTQYPALVYDKDANRGIDSTCRDLNEVNLPRELPRCGYIIPGQRSGLSDLELIEPGLNLAPDFDNIILSYGLTVSKNTEHIQLIPTAYSNDVTIDIRNGIGFSETIGSGTTSSKIPLSNVDETTLTIDVRRASNGKLQKRYRIIVNRYAFNIFNIDKDEDGLIDIDKVEKLDAIRYQADGSGYRESEDTTKITLGCPQDGCSGYELVNDIDFKNEAHYLRRDNQTTFTTGAAWLPIGDRTNPFSSTFKGNGKVISNLIINRPDAEGVGLFGELTSDASIESVGLSNVSILGKHAVGGLVGINHGLISKSYTSGIVTGSGNGIGGIIGDNTKANITASIIDSYADTWVIGEAGVGGLIGDGRGDRTGEVMENSYAVGKVDGLTGRGGLIGRRIGSARRSLTNSYWDKDSSGVLISAQGGNRRTTEQMQSPTAPGSSTYRNWHPDVWDFGTNKQYPALKDADGALFSNQHVGLRSIEPSFSGLSLTPDFRRNVYNYDMTVQADFSSITLSLHAYDEENSTIDVFSNAEVGNFVGVGTALSEPIPLKDSGETIITIDVQAPNGTLQYRIRVNRLNYFAAGSRIDIDKDDDGLIEIANRGQLDAMRHQVDGTAYQESETAASIMLGCDEGGSGLCKGYELIADIDLEGIDFEPIGTAEHPFSGVFEGNGHTISNLTIAKTDSDDVALFAYTSTIARINRVGLYNTEIVGRFGVGALVAENGGMISNSYVLGSVEGNNSVGGLVGYNKNLIINSYMSGYVSGKSSVGGLAGSNESGGDITHSYTLSSVSGHDTIGALVGENQGTIAESYATGDAQGSRVVGGLVGDNDGIVRNSYATVTVVGALNSGGLIGRNNDGSVSHSYWNTQSSGLVSSAGGLGLSTADLKSAVAQTGDMNAPYYNWNNNHWYFGTTHTYPILKYAPGNDIDNPACGSASVLPNCGTLQSYGLVGLNIVEPAMLSAAFDISRLNYQVKVNATAERIHLVPTALLADADINIVSNSGFSQQVPSGTTSTAIALNPSAATEVTIDVLSDAAVRYRLEVVRLPRIAAGIDIDDDDDGLIEIYTLEELNAMRHQLDGSGYKDNAASNKITAGCSIGGCRGYELIRDLNFKDNESYSDAARHRYLWTGGGGWQPIGSNDDPFVGTFDGNGYHISNLTIERPNSDSVALFGNIGVPAVIDNIGLLNVDIVGKNYVSALAATNQGAIKDAYAIGNLEVKGNYAGGLVGFNLGTITTSYADVNVDGSQINSDHVGGLVGNNDRTITNCYATGNVRGRNNIGGLVGNNISSAEIAYSYAIGDISGRAFSGGLIGTNSGTITNSYRSSDNQPDNGQGIGLTSAMLKSAQHAGQTVGQAYFQWNETIWDFGTAEQYPIIKYTDGTLLPMQRDTLLGLELSEGARLSPIYDPSILYYDVLVDAGIPELQLTPRLSNTAAMISIYKDGKSVQRSTTSVTIILNNVGATEITIVVQETQSRTITYKLIANYLSDIMIEGIPVGAVDEGELIHLDGTYRVGSTAYSYRWQQLSAHTLPDGLAMHQAVLTFNVPNKFVPRAVSHSEIKFRLEMSLNNELLASKTIVLTINKISNGFVISPRAPTLSGSELTAPSIDLSDDPDGSGSGSIAYQWQSARPATDAHWLDIEDARAKTYTVPSNVVDASRYRVLFSYVDGQGHIHEDIASKAYIVIDVDKDDDGLIEINDLEGVHAIRYQSDGTAYRDSNIGIKISTGCSTGGCRGYELIKDLDFNDSASYSSTPNQVVWTTLSGWLPINNFNSTFEGNGYTISNLYIDRDARNIGLFSITGRNAVIGDIGLLDVKILASRSGQSYAGALVGNNRGTIINSRVAGSISRGRLIGGLVGNNSGYIRNSYATCDVDGTSAAGLVGSNNNEIANSYVAGSVSGRLIGGLVNENIGTVVNSYVVANMTADIKGGLVRFGSGRVVHSYWDRQLSSTERSFGGLGFGSEQLKSGVAQSADERSPYYEWSNDNWDFGHRGQYPALKYLCVFNIPGTDIVLRSSKCGTLLPGQGVSSLLAHLILSSGVSLHPPFTPTVFNYRVQVDDFNSALQFTPIVANLSTKIKVSENDEAVMTISGGEPISFLLEPSTKTTIVFETLGIADARGVGYILDINIPPKVAIAGGQQALSLTEGDSVHFDAQAEDIGEVNILRYDWTQLSGPPLLSEPQNEQSLTITVADDLVASDKSSETAILKLAVSDGLASDNIQISLNIYKANNGFIATAESAPIWLGAYVVSAPEIDLNKDSDGAGDSGDIVYQWQEEVAGAWQDIDQATGKIYNLDKSAAYGSRYRVAISYADKQGYTMSLNSTATVLALDVDVDDDRLIELGDAESLTAIRYQLDGRGYRLSSDTNVITTGCKSGGCIGYELVADIDLSGVSFMPLGSAAEPFSGIFNGNGHTISNLYIDRLDDNIGLFGVVLNSTITAVALSDVYVKGIQNIGALVGHDRGGTTIINSYVRGNIEGRNRIGGLVGLKEGGTISNSYVVGDLSGFNLIGGLVGDNADGSAISNSYVHGNVSGNSAVGGLAGSNSNGRISNSYAVVGITAAAGNVGGLIGSGDVLNSYWDTTISGINGGAGVGLLSTQLRAPITPGRTAGDAYHRWSSANWDFGNQRQYPAVKYLCDNPSQSPNCGHLLSAQRSGLFDVVLGKGARLSPSFDSNHYNYSVAIDADTTQLRLTPIANDSAASVTINESFDVASGNISPSILLQTATENVITLQVKASNERLYRLTIDNRLPQIELTGIPQQAVDEGETVALTVSVADGDGDELHYRWSQTSGVDVLSGVDNLSGVIVNQNDADLSFSIADNLLAARQNRIDIELVLTVSDGKTSVDAKVPLTINKSNSFISGIFLTTLQGLTYEAPEIDLSEDPDGINPTPELNYQWQYFMNGLWRNIAAATNATYLAREFIGHQHRVLISYIDGQGYENTVASQSSSFVVATAQEEDTPGLLSLSIVIGERTETLDLSRRIQTVAVASPDIEKITVIAKAVDDAKISINGEPLSDGEAKDIPLNKDGETIFRVDVGDEQPYIVTVTSPLKIRVHIKVYLEGLLPSKSNPM